MNIQYTAKYGTINYPNNENKLVHLMQMFVQEDSMLLFSFYKRNIDFINEDMQQFINSRTQFTNGEWVLPWEESIVFRDSMNKLPEIFWYAVKTKEEILQAIHIDIDFRCVVLEKGKPFEQYHNVLFHQEHYLDEDEEDDESLADYALCFTNLTHFKNDVLPQLKNL